MKKAILAGLALASIALAVATTNGSPQSACCDKPGCKSCCSKQAGGCGSCCGKTCSNCQGCGSGC